MGEESEGNMQNNYCDEEIIQIYSCFKELRQSRGYTQKDVSDEVVSKDMISKFERGANMLSADKLCHAIANINMTPNEFMSTLNGFKPSRLQKLYDTLNNIRFSYPKSVVSAEELIVNDTKNKFNVLSNIMIKSVIQDVTGENYVSSDEKTLVGNYLNGIENWTTFELKLLYYVCPILDIGDVKWFGEILLERRFHYFVGENRSLIINVLMNLYDTVLDHQDIEYADFFRKNIETFDISDNLNAIVNFRILKDVHDYIVSRTNENFQNAILYLDSIEKIGLTSIISHCKERLKKLAPPEPDI